MRAKIAVVKQVTTTRHVVRRSNKTLWWGQAMANWTLSEMGVPVSIPPVFVFAKNVAEAETKIVHESAKQCDARYSNFRMSVAPQEVELSAER